MDTMWTLLAHEACGKCIEALRRLSDRLAGQPLTLEIAEAPPELEAAAPVLMDPHGQIVWEGAFDEARTLEALRRVARRGAGLNGQLLRPVP